MDTAKQQRQLSEQPRRRRAGPMEGIYWSGPQQKPKQQQS